VCVCVPHGIGVCVCVWGGGGESRAGRLGTGPRATTPPPAHTHTASGCARAPCRAHLPRPCDLSTMEGWAAEGLAALEKGAAPNVICRGGAGGGAKRTVWHRPAQHSAAQRTSWEHAAQLDCRRGGWRAQLAPQAPPRPLSSSMQAAPALFPAFSSAAPRAACLEGADAAVGDVERHCQVLNHKRILRVGSGTDRGGWRGRAGAGRLARAGRGWQRRAQG
jgi:hypothetical protein